MAMMNFSATIGKKLASWFDARMGYGEILIFWGIFQAIVIVVLLVYIDPHERRAENGDPPTTDAEDMEKHEDYPEGVDHE